MTKEEFISLINEYRTITEYNHEYYKFGIDLDASKFPIMSSVDNLLYICLRANYTKEGVEWIEWFMYECYFGRKSMEAVDEHGNLICQTIEDLYDYIQKHKK